MNAAGFRKELLKIMPGYSWTVNKPGALPIPGRLEATGTQSSGFNRLSTLKVIRTEPNDRCASVWYEVKSAPHGVRSPWAATVGNVTLARALRDLQSHYERQAAEFSVLASRLRAGRHKSTDLVIVPLDKADRLEGGAS